MLISTSLMQVSGYSFKLTLSTLTILPVTFNFQPTFHPPFQGLNSQQTESPGPSASVRTSKPFTFPHLKIAHSMVHRRSQKTRVHIKFHKMFIKKCETQS